MTMSNTRTSALALYAGLFLTQLLSACGGGGGGSAAAPNPPSPPPTAYEYKLPSDTGDTWSIASAADQGLSVTVLEDMMNDIRAGMFPAIDSIAISKGGVLVFDETIRTTTDFRDSRVNNTNPEMHAQFSVSKSITSLVVGIAIDEGHIGGVDAPYLSLFPYPSYDNWDVRKDDITLEDVLTMRLGLEWDEWDPDYSSPDNQWNQFVENEFDFSKALLDLPMAADPGTAFAYNSAATVSLGQAVENSAPMAAIDFGLNELFMPMGITNIEVLRTPTGLPQSGGGFYLLTRDALKFGQLLVNDGTWNGKRIVSSEWLAESLTPRTALGFSDPTEWDWQLEGYGYQWWTGHYEHNGTTYAAYVAWGYGGQWIVAIPELDLAVAVNSNAYDGPNASINEGHALIRNYVLEGLGL
jgi:CubicO group peptidase (beta-lactamase class C family)